MSDENATRAGFTKVPFSCTTCDADFELYHDGVSHQVVNVICKCGTTNRWESPPSLGDYYRGFGIKFGGQTLLRSIPPVFQLEGGA